MGKEVHAILEFPPEVLEMVVSHLKDEKSSKAAALICPTFHELICYLRKDKPQSLLLNQEVIDNDETFENILNSKRRVNEIKIKCRSDFESKKYLEILKKFKPYMKKFSIVTVSASKVNLFGLFVALSEVEELELDIKELSKTIKRRFIELQSFSKLKSLRLISCPKLLEFFELIPDDLLVKLEISWDNETAFVSRLLLQAFVNRQKKIKRLKIKAFCDIDHLVLEELKFILDLPDDDEEPLQVPDQGRLISMLEKQPELRSLTLVALADETTFAKVCQLPKLEHLSVWLNDVGDRSCIAGLNNLQRLISLKLIDHERSGLEYWPGSAFLGQLKLPKLQQLTLIFLRDKLNPEVVAAMSDGMESLQELEIDGPISLLPRVIENFRTLKTLQMEIIRCRNLLNAAPSRRNESLVTLKLRTWFCPGKTTYDAIKACPNLKRLDLTAVGGLNADLLEWVQSHPKLESLRYFGSDFPSQEQEELQQSALLGIIEHFRKTPNFVSLEMSSYCYQADLEALFGEDIGKVDIKKTRYVGSDYAKRSNFFIINKKLEA